ncbi:Fur family transcriptional regulator [Flexibacterium corallicola]|uniref:Fur family transcriptional regulator n=1 Tax=Flexibacterium corallicola TaxID=3037259 RepID=UPI00286F3F10|nr:transcriptional repressor [Pseudovibrio sp. M1P-2-3]
MLDRVNFDTVELLRKAGLRPTKQRRTIAHHLFKGQHRHVDAATLHEEACCYGENIALATIYNILHDFERVQLIRRVAVSAERTWYDTDTGDHRHYYIGEEDRIMDCPEGNLELGTLADPPSGYTIKSVDIVIHLEPTDKPQA